MARGSRKAAGKSGVSEKATNGGSRAGTAASAENITASARDDQFGLAVRPEAATLLSAIEDGAVADLMVPGVAAAESPLPSDAAAPAQQVSSLRGFIDEAKPDAISGWVWDPERPQQRLTVDLLAGDARIARVAANEFRADLAQAGIGDGRHAFKIALTRQIIGEGQALLRLVDAETNAELPGSPITMRQYVPLKPSAETLPVKRDGKTAGSVAKAASDGSRLQSHIESADRTGVKGWIWNPREPEQRTELGLWVDDSLLTTVLADQYRPDLERSGFGDGRYGFSISFSEALLPYARHVLHLRPMGATADLPGFPLAVTRHDAGFDPTVRLLLDNIRAEAQRAETVEELAPVVGDLVAFLDAAVARYAEMQHDGEASAANLLSPAELTSQFRTMVESLHWNYPVLRLDTDSEPVASVVIPVFNKFQLTYNCVKSLIEAGAEIPFEIIVVDDCSRDETLLSSFVFGSGIRLIRNPTNYGFVRSCNRGFDAARGNCVVYLNNDTEVKPRWLDELYETLQRDPTIGVVGSKLLYPDGSLQECGGIIWRLGDGWNWGRGENPEDPRFSFMRDADYVSGAALMVRKGGAEGFGKFDELFVPMYYEDTDLCFRARQAGYRVVVQPASEVVHFEGASAGTSTQSGMKRYQSVNQRKFFDRWKETLATHRFNGEFPEREVERNVRQRAFFIDDSIPEPDKDAGSNAAFQHMMSLQRLGYKVTFIPADNMAKIDPYTQDLQRRGVECLYHPLYFSVEDVFRKQRIPVELVYLHRYSNASKYAGMLRQHFPAARILYNVADLHFLRAERQAELEDDAALRGKAEQLRRLELGAMSFVDCVIVHSDAEAELLRKIAPGVEVQVIPWTVPVRKIARKATRNPGIAFIGGYRHPPNADAAKFAVQGIMPLLRKEIPGVELLLVGSHMPGEVSALSAKDVVPLGYVPTLDSVFERIRLTIAPLRFGAGLKGKVLESMAAGIPCVMTGVAAEGLNLPSELQGLVADDPAALTERIAALCRDNDRYRRVAKACQIYIEANYSPERIDSLIRQACQIEAGAA